MDASGSLFVMDYSQKVRRITPAGQVSTLAGEGVRGYVDGPGNIARFSGNAGVAVDRAGNVYVADEYNNCIRKISPSGSVTTLAGSGQEGYSDGQGSRVPLTKDQRIELEERARRRAFTVAGVAKLDAVSNVWQSMERAIADGLPLKDFKREVASGLLDAWRGTVENSSARMETIFRVQVQEAYNAGRWRQMTEPAVLRARPLWMYDAILDSRIRVA